MCIVKREVAHQLLDWLTSQQVFWWLWSQPASSPPPFFSKRQNWVGSILESSTRRSVCRTWEADVILGTRTCTWNSLSFSCVFFFWVIIPKASMGEFSVIYIVWLCVCQTAKTSNASPWWRRRHALSQGQSRRCAGWCTLALGLRPCWSPFAWSCRCLWTRPLPSKSTGTMLLSPGIHVRPLSRDPVASSL